MADQIDTNALNDLFDAIIDVNRAGMRERPTLLARI